MARKYLSTFEKFENYIGYTWPSIFASAQVMLTLLNTLTTNLLQATRNTASMISDLVCGRKVAS